jgi:hypothetical protein
LLLLALAIQAKPVLAQSYYGQGSTTAPNTPSTAAPPRTLTISHDAAPPPPPARNLTFSHDWQPVQAVSAQPIGGKDMTGKDTSTTGKFGFETLEFRNLREVPHLEVLTRLESEPALFERMRQESLRSGDRIVFPEEPPVTKQPYKGRQWPLFSKEVEPYYVVHGRLLFEQQNFERGLWDLGILGPPLSAGKFFCDAFFLPYNLATRPCQQYDTDAGKCLPGDPTPLYLYPVELSLTGLIAEGAAITGAFFIFP